MKTKFLLTKMLVLIAFISGTVLAQTDIAPETKFDMPGNWGYSTNENLPKKTFAPSPIPNFLFDQYKNAKLNRNEDEKIRVGAEMQKYLEPSMRPPEGSYEKTTIITEPQAPFSPDWYTSDVQVHNGSVAYSGGYRQLDLKRGEDGWLYLAVNRRNVSGYNGYITLYRSSNGGAAWTIVIQAYNITSYFGTLSMLVERRSETNDDSTRIMLFYTRSTSSNFDNAGIEVLSVRRTGAAAFVDMFGAPAGHKYEYPSACSDGAYQGAATYMHVIARECTNAGLQVGLRHWLSTNWCSSFTNILINTYNSDYYPSAAYCEKGTGNDSIYIAVERRINSTEYEIRAIITCEWLTSNHFAYYITSAGSNTKYERPCITVQQQQASVPRRVLITYTRNNYARYCRSINGGQSWTVDAVLGSNGLADYTWCNSDSLTAGDGYAVASYVDQNGDSVTVRRGNMTGSLGTFWYKRNSVMSTGYLTPVCAVYKVGTNKYAAFAYAGQGPSNVYFNAEHLVIGIPPKGEIPSIYSLNQNYPNPFNPATTISFSLPKAGQVSLKIYDVLGNEIATLINENMSANSYQVTWDASAYASGVYFYKLVSGDFTDVKKMMLVK